MRPIYLVIFLVVNTVWAGISPSEIKGLHTTLHDDYRILSPLPGLIWQQGGIYENLGELSNKRNHPVVILIKQLSQRVDESTYRFSISKESISKYLLPFDLGRLALRLYYSRNQTAATEIRNIINDNEGYQNSSKGGSSSAKALRNDTNKFITNLVVATNHYVNNKTDDITVFKMLATLATLKSNDKRDVLRYFQGIKFELEQINEPLRKANKNEIEVFAEDFLRDDKSTESWLNDKFHDSELEDPLSLSAHYELRAAAILHSRSNSPIDSYLTRGRHAVLKSGAGFPDCGETSILNLLRVLFGDFTTLTINLDLLEKVLAPRANDRSKEKILSFFKTIIPASAGSPSLDFSRLADLRSDSARNAFAEVASNLGPSIDYGNVNAHESFNISGSRGFDNMKNVLRALFGYDNVHDLAQQIMLHNPTDVITVATNLDDKKEFGTIEIIKNGCNFSWVFQSLHFAFLPKPKNIFSRDFLLTLLADRDVMRDLISLVPASRDNTKFDLIFAPHNLSDHAHMHGIFYFDEMFQYLLALNKNRVQHEANYTSDDKSLITSIITRALVTPRRIVTEDQRNLYFRELLPAGLSHIDDEVLRLIERTFPLHYKIAAYKKLYSPTEFANFLSANAGSLQTIDSNGQSYLHWAARLNWGEHVVKMLAQYMSHDVINAIDNQGDSALHIAAKTFVSTDTCAALLELVSSDTIRRRNNRNNSGLSLIFGAKAITVDTLYQLLMKGLFDDDEVLRFKSSQNNSWTRLIERLINIYASVKNEHFSKDKFSILLRDIEPVENLLPDATFVYDAFLKGNYRFDAQKLVIERLKQADYDMDENINYKIEKSRTLGRLSTTQIDRILFELGTIVELTEDNKQKLKACKKK